MEKMQMKQMRMMRLIENKTCCKCTVDTWIPGRGPMRKNNNFPMTQCLAREYGAHDTVVNS